MPKRRVEEFPDGSFRDAPVSLDDFDAEQDEQDIAWTYRPETDE